jgi:hypothetical protein
MQVTAIDALIPRRANGTVMPGYTANPGGRPKTAIDELRARYLPRLPEYLEALDKLTRSKHEATQLAAIREILDRLLGKPAVFVDATHTKVDIAALYLQALKAANEPPQHSHVVPNPECIVPDKS